MDYYDDKLRRSGSSYLACFFSIVGVSLLLAVSFFAGRCSGYGRPMGDTLSVDSTLETEVIIKYIHDTLPPVKGERIVRYVKIPAIPLHDDVDVSKNPDSLNTSGDSLCDGRVTLPVVQRRYSDDSTYTAYVSGLQYQGYPCLDSIALRQRTVVNTIVRTVMLSPRRRRWSFGVQAGYGVGLQSGRVEPYLGVGVSYAF